MHAILDVAEMLLTENMDAKTTDRTLTRLYRPRPDDKVVPRGFDQASQVNALAGMEAMIGDG